MTGSVKYVAVLIGILCSLEGCVGTRTAALSNDTAAMMHAKTLAISRRGFPDFGAMTAGKAMFGMIGAVAMIRAGNKIARDNGFEDPATYIGPQLATALEGKYGIVAASGPEPLAKTTDTRELAGLYSASDYVLDVQTVSWGFLYRPSLTHYRVMYSVKARLIDTHHPRLVAEAFCARIDDGDKHPPTRAELLADHAAMLKLRLHDDASQCVGELERKILGNSGAKSEVGVAAKS